MARVIPSPGRSAGLLAVGAVLLLGTACTTPEYYYTVDGEPIVFAIDSHRFATGVPSAYFS